MKIPIVILALFGLVCGNHLSLDSLQNDLKEFLELVPTNKVLEIALDYLANDQEVREFVVYIQSEKFPPIHTIVERIKEYKECSKFINEQGVDVYAITNEIHHMLGYPPFQPTNTTRKGVGFPGLIDDVIAVLPLQDMTAFLDKKMETGEFFKTLLTAIRPPVFTKMVETVRAWPEYPELLEILRQMVVPVERISKLLWEITKRETHNIQEEVKEYLAVIPTDKVLSIILDYLANDPEFHKAIVYIQSEKFPMIHETVEHLKEYKDCLKFITDDGVDVYAFIYEVNYILGLPPLPTINSTRMGVGIYGLFEDVIAVLPLNDLKAFYDKKVETREYFKTLVTLVTALKSHVVKMVDTVRAWPEYNKVLEIVREKDLHVDSLIEILRILYVPSLRGIHRLHDEVKKYVAYFPTDEVLEIVLDYLANDEEVREFLVYIQSEEFPEIHTVVERIKEYKGCSKFINEQGVDVYAIVNEIHHFFERHPFEPTNTKRMGVGIVGLIDDVIAVLPLEDLTAFLDKKMETGESFKYLLKVIRPLKFMKMVDTVRAWPEYPELLEILRKMVVPVERISKLLWEITKRETHTIQEDVKEFITLFPTDKVLSITLDYLANDPELHEAIVYIQSEKFPMIHKTVEYLKEYKDCLTFITDDGVDVYAFIYEVNYVLGLPPLPTINTTRMGVGIYGLIDDVIAVLPLNELKAYNDKKVETREYFKTLVTLVKAFKYPVVKIVDIVRAQPEYHKMLETLRQKGVDVERIVEHLRPLYSLLPLY